MKSLIWMIVAFLTVLLGHSRWTHVILDMNDGGISYRTERLFQVNSCNPWNEWCRNILQYWRVILGELMQSLIWMIGTFLTVLQVYSRWTHTILGRNDGGIFYSTAGSFQVNSYSSWYDWWWYLLQYCWVIPGKIMQSLPWMLRALKKLLDHSRWTHAMNAGCISYPLVCNYT